MAIHTPPADTQTDLDVPEFMRTETAVDRPNLSLVKPSPEPVEGPVVKHQGETLRPTWIDSGKQLAARAQEHAAENRLYIGWTVRGYRALGRRWLEARRDGHPQMIQSAKAEREAAASDTAAEAAAHELVQKRRAEYRLHKRWHWIKTGGWGAAGTTGITTAMVVGGGWVDVLLALGAYAVGTWHGRPALESGPLPAGELGPSQEPREASQLGEETMRRALVEAGVVPEKRGEEIYGVGLPHTEGAGTAYTVDLPSGIPATVALGKAEQIASALGVHKDWMDLGVDRSKGSNASRLKVWVASEDPFARAHTSPLIGHRGPIDLWNDGAPLAFGKRGNTVRSRTRDSMLLVAGATRRGKGVFIANLNLAGAKDVRINLRLFDGKASGEHNAFSPLLSTFVKKNPERLALFLRAMLEDMDRRADFLDERGKAKLSEDLIEAIGGIELIDIDELATYTAKGTSSFRDEIIESLCQIGAVGASLGVLLVCATQVPEVDVVPGRLRQNLISRAAMNTESPNASNTILGDGMAGQGYDASTIPLDQPGRFWFKSPDLGTVSLRSFFIEDDDKEPIIAEAVELRRAAGRLPGQWHDPIEAKLAAWTGVSSAAGGERGNGRITKVTVLERLEILAKATGRGSITNAEVLTAFAVHDPARYGRKDGENDRGWTTRVGKVIKDELEAMGSDLDTKRVPGPDGDRSVGYLLGDVSAARNALK